jgi:hypothetical protein
MVVVVNLTMFEGDFRRLLNKQTNKQKRKKEKKRELYELWRLVLIKVAKDSSKRVGIGGLVAKREETGQWTSQSENPTRI